MLLPASAASGVVWMLSRPAPSSLYQLLLLTVWHSSSGKGVFVMLVLLLCRRCAVFCGLSCLSLLPCVSAATAFAWNVS
jgi:hypothetical protein